MAVIQKHTLYTQGKDVHTVYEVAEGTKVICYGSSLQELNLNLRTMGFDTLANMQGIQLQIQLQDIQMQAMTDSRFNPPKKRFLDVIIVEGLSRKELSQLAVLLTSE